MNEELPKKRKNKVLFLCLCIWVVLIEIILCCGAIVPEKISAGTLDNAYDFYSTYGTKTVFIPTTKTDGRICFGNAGVASTAPIRFSTIGWKMKIYSNDTLIQEIYYQLGGKYLVETDSRVVGKYEYALYQLSLKDMKRRMSEQSKRALTLANAKIVFDACNVVFKNGSLQGGMTDNGPSWGTVYTSYDGIANAESWSKTTKELFHEYYDRKVEGLFYHVEVGGDDHIEKAGPTGDYCYGTEIMLTVTEKPGYMFSHWGGTVYTEVKKYYFYVNGDSNWYAYTHREPLKITYHRISSSRDMAYQDVYYKYGGEDNRFLGDIWGMDGKGVLGWSESKTNLKIQYKTGDVISNQFIIDKAPHLHLYAVWGGFTYTIEYNGNGDGVKGSTPATNVEYSKSFNIANSGFTREGYQFVGWSLSPASTTADYKAGKKVLTSTLVKKLGKQRENNATITLYAIWDGSPSIEAYDLFFPLSDARAGRLTEVYLSAFGKANDPEDGAISYGWHSNNSFVITNYNGGAIRSLNDGQSTDLTWRVKDSKGNMTTKTVKLTVVENAPKEIEKVELSIRFISDKYFEDENGKLIPEAAGGLPSDSDWCKDISYRSLLKDALRK